MARSIRFCTSRGSLPSSFSASRESSTAQAMFHGAPWPGVAALELRLAFADFPGLLLGQNVIGIHELFGLHEDPAGFCCDFHEIPFLKPQSIENRLGNDNL